MTRFDVRVVAGAVALASVFAVATAGATLADEGPWDHGHDGGWHDGSIVTMPVAGWPGGMAWDHDGGWDDGSHDGGWDDAYHHDGDGHDGDHGGESHHGGYDDHGHDD